MIIKMDHRRIQIKRPKDKKIDEDSQEMKLTDFMHERKMEEMGSLALGIALIYQYKDMRTTLKKSKGKLIRLDNIRTNKKKYTNLGNGKQNNYMDISSNNLVKLYTRGSGHGFEK